MVALQIDSPGKCELSFAKGRLSTFCRLRDDYGGMRLRSEGRRSRKSELYHMDSAPNMCLACGWQRTSIGVKWLRRIEPRGL